MTIVVMISLGLCMFTYKATSFNGLGFSFLLFASVASGLRWSFAQLIMQKSKLGLHNPVDMVFHMQPWMILSVVPFTIGFEGHRLYDGWLQLMADADGSVESADVAGTIAKIVGGACIAFCMELSEFLVLSYTSSLTLAVSGIMKDICQLVLAVDLNGDRMSPLNVCGLVMCLGGIGSHVWHKYQTLMRKTGDGDSDGLTTSSATASSSSSGSMLSNGGGDKSLPMMWRSPTSTSGNTQAVPLLDNISDSDDDDDDVGGVGGRNGRQQSSSEIIFDVLKRRDTPRMLSSVP